MMESALLIGLSAAESMSGVNVSGCCAFTAPGTKNSMRMNKHACFTY